MSKGCRIFTNKKINLDTNIVITESDRTIPYKAIGEVRWIMGDINFDGIPKKLEYFDKKRIERYAYCEKLEEYFGKLSKGYRYALGIELYFGLPKYINVKFNQEMPHLKKTIE